MTARVYLAGGSSERLTVCRPLIERLQSAGVSVHDWTNDPAFSLGREPTLAELRDAAHRDLHALVDAQIMWLVVPVQKSEGSAGEFLAGILNGHTTVVSGEVGVRNVFALLADHICETHEEAFDMVKRLALEWETK